MIFITQTGLRFQLRTPPSSKFWVMACVTRPSLWRCWGSNSGPHPWQKVPHQPSSHLGLFAAPDLMFQHPPTDMHADTHIAHSHSPVRHTQHPLPSWFCQSLPQFPGVLTVWSTAVCSRPISALVSAQCPVSCLLVMTAVGATSTQCTPSQMCCPSGAHLCSQPSLQLKQLHHTTEEALAINPSLRGRTVVLGHSWLHSEVGRGWPS